MRTDMLRDSSTYVETVSDTPPKTHETPHIHAYMLIIRDKHTVIWAGSGFPDMTECCSEMLEQRRGHRRRSKAKW